MSTEIEYRVTDGVAIIGLNAPERRNALSPAMADSMVEAFEAADADASVGAVIIKGAPNAFCAGMHLGHAPEIFSDPAGDAAYDATGRIYHAFVRAGSLKAPTISAVRGSAVGAGMNLLLATDVRIVADNVRLLSGFTRIGVHPGGGHMMLLAQITSPATAAAMAVFGEEVDGPRAVQLGLAWKSVPDREVEDCALAMAKRAAADPDLARAVVKTLRMTTGSNAVPWPVALQAERAPQLWSMRRAGKKGAPGKPA